jgi:endonuclease G
MKAAAGRWRIKAPEVARAAARLALGGPAAAASPARTAAYVAREAAKRTLRVEGIGFERRIGDTLDLDDIAPSVEARIAGTPVARIVELYSGPRIGDGFATGFLVASNLLVTNWHVFETRADATDCGAEFGFERNQAGQLQSGVVFEIDAAAFFLSNKELDIAIVGLKTVPAIGSGVPDSYGAVRLIPTLGKILVGHPVNIIQHPDGRHKHWGVRQNKLVAEPADADVFLSYTTDTLPGSSGSPAFNVDWELVAVHHSGVPRLDANGNILTKMGTIWQKDMSDNVIDYVANEGARVSRIVNFLQATTVTDAREQALLSVLLSRSTDPVLGGELAYRGAVAGGAIVLPRMSQVPASSGATMNITVHGTANFYGGATLPAERPQVPAATFTSLPVAVEKKIRFDSQYSTRPGYKATFLSGFEVPVPEGPTGEVLTQGNAQRIFKYHHYSLVMHADRRLAMWTASNVNYDPNTRWRAREEFGSDTWKGDPRLLIEQQIEDIEFYAPAKKFDRGHLVRRDDVAWGETMEEEEFGNSDSFHWTNCTPQHEGFNRDMFQYNGLWGQVENHIATQAGYVQNKLIVMAGPVLNDSDPERDFGSGIKVKVPIVFWKVVVAVEDVSTNPRLRAYGFLLDQTQAIDEYGWENRFRVGRFKEQQMSLAEITARSRVIFDASLHAADPLANDSNESRGRPLRALEDIRLR